MDAFPHGEGEHHTMAITTTNEMFTHELSDMYDAEHRFLKGQEEMLAQASDPELKEMIQTHIQQTEQQIKNLDQVFSLLGQKAKGEKCDAAAGLVSEAQKTMKEASVVALRDCVIGTAATKVEHYEIVNYRGLVAGAEGMGQTKIVALLRTNLAQEEQTAQKLEKSAPQLLKKAKAAEGK